MDTMLLVWTGLVAGSLHVVAGPDHLVALAPVALNDRLRAARLGGIWGLGHGVGVAILGCLGLAAAQVVDVGVLSAWSEFAVGLTLVVVGCWSIRRAGRIVIHRHAHAHASDPEEHQHLHVHTGERHDSDAHVGHSHAAFGIGFLHGAAGTGHLFGVVPALALPGPDAAVYIASYLVSAVCSMALFGGTLGKVVSLGGQRVMRGMMSTSGAAAIVLGVFWSASGWPL